MKPIDLTPIFEKYPGKWVALKGDKKTVIASGKNAKVVYEKAIRKGVKIPTLFKVPTASVPFVG